MGKLVYRHIGYYNDVEDIDILKNMNADEVVEWMKNNLGAFHSTTGECESDIENPLLEQDKDSLFLTTDKNYVVRYEITKNNIDSFIDIYQCTNVEHTTIVEWCPYCCDEVELANEFAIQKCPFCGKMIVPCNLCPGEHKCDSCKLTILCEQLNENSND